MNDRASYLAPMTPRDAGRASKALDRPFRYQGAVLTRAELVERLIREGARVTRRSARHYAAEKRLSARIAEAAERAPMGNPNHPDTQAVERLRADLQRAKARTERTLTLPSDFYFTEDGLGGIALDYAEHLLRGA